jgi:cation transport regulator ChaB
MPKTKRSGEPVQGELPSTLRRSPKEAQETFATEEYGEGERAYRVAYSALKRKFEKKGDRWVRKNGKGPSDPRAANPRAREGKGKSYGGVDFYGSTKEELLRRARDLDVQGRSTMSKEELAEAIARKQS